MTEHSKSGRPPVRWEDALRELARVHDLEQSRLLRAASWLRLRRAQIDGGPALPPPRSRGELHGARTAKEWRSTALEEVRTARADGASVDPALAGLVGVSVESWPRASSIAASALALAPGSESILALARARLSERKLEDALEILLDFLGRDPLGEAHVAALETIAAGLELAGDVEGSLAFQEAALNSERGDLRQAVPLLALALLAGDDARASLASRRLHRVDLTVPGLRSRFDAALLAARRRFASTAHGESTSSPSREGRIREFLRRNRGPEAEVARLVLRG